LRKRVEQLEQQFAVWRIPLGLEGGEPVLCTDPDDAAGEPAGENGDAAFN